MSSTSRRRIGVAVLAILLGPLAGISPAIGVEAGGKLPPAQLAFNPTSHDYGSVTVGQEASATFTLSNTGGKGATSLRVILSGAGMSITANSCGKSLKSGLTCDVTVAFAPQGAGAVAGTLTASARGTLPAIVTLTGTGVAPAADRYLYWGYPDIGRAQLDGSTPNPQFVTLTDNLSSLDVGAGYIYWVYAGSVMRIPVDGIGSPQSVYTGSYDETLGVALSETYVYWTNYSMKEIWRADLDGSDAQAILTGLDNPTGLDVYDDYLYWSEYSGASTSKIRRVPLSNLASTPEILFEYPEMTTSGPAGLEVGGGRVYWAQTDWNDYSGSVLSVPVTGSVEARVDVTLSAPNRIDDVALDTDGGWLYYTVNADDYNGDDYDSSIARRPLDGSGSAETVVSGIWMAYTLAIG